MASGRGSRRQTRLGGLSVVRLAIGVPDTGTNTDIVRTRNFMTLSALATFS
jgi:hypothetical protein